MSRAPMPKIPPVDPTTCRPDVAELLRAGSEATGGADNVGATLANNPGLFRRYMPLAGKLLGSGKLTPRDRELAILRTAHLCRCDYEWRHHVRIALDEGFTAETIEAVKEAPDVERWTEHDLAILQATDQLVIEHRVQDATFERLRADLSTEQLIELLVLVGNYTLLAGFLNSLDVAYDDGTSRQGS